MYVYNTTNNISIHTISLSHTNYIKYIKYIYDIYNNYIIYIKTIYIVCVIIYYFNDIAYLFLMVYMYSRSDLLYLNNNNVHTHNNIYNNTIRNEIHSIFREYEEAILNYHPIHYIEVVAPYIESSSSDSILHDNLICSICLEDFDNVIEDGLNKKVRLTLCGHYYCDTCIERWLTSHDTCPMCKYDFSLHDNFTL